MTASVRAGLFDRQRLLALPDWLAIGVALSLPWSTSLTGIVIALWLLAVLPTLDRDMLWRELASPAGGLPVLLWAFAVFGMLWADVTWSERCGGLEGFLRLLAIPLLLAQFRRSDKGAWVLYGYLISAICLLLTSWTFALVPALQSRGNFYGVPVKDYILQAGEFLICGFALLGIAGPFAGQRKWRRPLCSSRSLFFSSPIMLRRHKPHQSLGGARACRGPGLAPRRPKGRRRGLPRRIGSGACALVQFAASARLHAQFGRGVTRAISRRMR